MGLGLHDGPDAAPVVERRYGKVFGEFSSCKHMVGSLKQGHFLGVTDITLRTTLS